MLTHHFLPWITRCSAVARLDRYVIGYAAGNFGKAILLGSIDVTLLFLLTDIIAMPPQRVSLLMVLVLAGDLVFDFIAGIVAGKAQRRGIGYPRLIVLCVVPCALAYCALYSLPLLGIAAFPAVTALVLCLRCTFAMLDVPHNALLARVTTDSHARGRASGYRTLFSSAASIAVASVLAPLVQRAAGPAMPALLAAVAALGGLLLCGTLLLAAWSSNEQHIPVQPPVPPAQRARSLPVPDRLFAAMAAIALITGFAPSMFTKLLLYLCTYVLDRPGFAAQLLLVLAVSQMAGAFFWITRVRHHDKTTLLAWSHGIAALGLALFAAAGNRPALLLALTVVIGIGYAGIFMLPWGILADLVDFAEFRHRDRRETAWFATVLVMMKGGGGAALATVGSMLGTLGYVPGAVQTAAVRSGMQALAFGVPIGGSLLAVLVLRRLAIGHALHARVTRINLARRELAGRRAPAANTQERSMPASRQSGKPPAVSPVPCPVPP